ncbi:MAG TPA: PAS domain-containing protein [Vicinamibacterales bacterium]|jgi:PAS domain S-box-containing protein
MRKPSVAWWFALGLLLFPASRAVAADGGPTRVLVIHQYSMDMPFRTAFDPALQKALRAAVHGPLQVYSEVLETSRFPAPQHADLMRRFLREKYDGRTISVVVAVYDTALDFVRTYHDELFPGVPVVALTTRKIDPRPGEALTGIWTGSSLADTVRLGMRLHPDATHLYVVESAFRNIGAYQEAARSLRDFEPRLAVTNLRDRPLAEVEAALRAAPADSFILYLRQLIGADGENIDQANGLASVIAASPLPVYGITQSLVGSGLIGGYVSSVEGNAARIAELTQRVASGTSPAAILPTAGVVVPFFDWRELRKHGIDERRLPADSRVLFKEVSFWSQYRIYVMGAAVVIALQAVLIGALLVHRRQRQHAEEALRRSESRNRATLRALPDLMFLFNKEGVYLDYHARDPGMLVVPPDKLLGRRLADVMPPDLVPMFMRELALASRDNEPRVLDYALTLDGRVRQFEARLVACEGEGDIVMSLVRDVTEQRRANEDVLQSRQRYELATSVCGAGVWDWNLATLDFYIDRTFVTLLGYDGEGPNRFEGLLEYVHPHDRPGTEAAARACVDGVTTTYAQEHRMVCRDGSIRWFQYRGTAVTNGNALPTRFVGTFWDITDRKEAEAALRTSELALRSTNSELQNLAGRLIAAQEEERARIARDLHDDMGQKLALLTIDIDQLGRRGTLSNEAAEHVRQVSDRAAEIASDMHRLSYQLHPTKLEALGLVPSIQSVCRDVSNQHAVLVEFRHQFVPPDLDPEISLCLFRIVQESLRNVVRHSGARRALVRVSGSKGELHLHIADQGRGFDVEEMSRAGLGLLSMRERVKFVGGDIVIRSAPGTGTRIGVRVPCASARSAEDLAEAPEADQSKTA